MYNSKSDLSTIYPNIHAILDIPKELINNLVQQINNVNARKAGSDEGN